MRRLLFCALVLTITSSAFADKRLLNLDDDGIALQGYDPIGYFTEGKPVQGDARIIAKHDGAVYRFASEQNRQTFLADPDKYAPQFGGYCAYGVSRDALAPISVARRRISMRAYSGDTPRRSVSLW